ncbi:KH homology domain-containing protein 1-like [Perognathus longimembris pacificus]|uniref:KH homology domain-containing protein 1-like n=1 Tax=Perognathus longimembris pacificus TaxID=214514 RepID=UPI002018F6C8|nr:KH homology domain-containing protein 1-like [Perognathus longimembris pacificus]XP_048210457.1 KH homology domain-containing protein 1-like [Perognathus longimembris pacificus]XP_048210462.1 KH homology domain-containing protein 1-like [Perognathus longimembris pacificus]
MDTCSLSMGAWWTEPENFSAPLVFYLEEEQEEEIFGQEDRYLLCMEEHSHTLIQLEPWFTVTGHTRVTVVGSPRARQWLMGMIWLLEHKDFHYRARGYQMLQSVRSQPLTTKDLAACLRVQLDSLVVKGYQDK